MFHGVGIEAVNSGLSSTVLHPTLSKQREREVLLEYVLGCTYVGGSEEGSGEGVAVFYSERRRELLMLSLIRGGEKAASHNLGLQSEQKKERTWGQEVTVLPPPGAVMSRLQ